jgi:hypothetical protein
MIPNRAQYIPESPARRKPETPARDASSRFPYNTTDETGINFYRAKLPGIGIRPI